MMEDSYVETKVEALEDNRTKVTVTVDAADIDARIKKTYKDFANKYNFPGFRKGKAPRPIIDNALPKARPMPRSTSRSTPCASTTTRSRTLPPPRR